MEEPCRSSVGKPAKMRRITTTLLRRLFILGRNGAVREVCNENSGAVAIPVSHMLKSFGALWENNLSNLSKN